MTSRIHQRAPELYLDLLKGVLVRQVVREKYQPLSGRQWSNKPVHKAVLAGFQRILSKKNLELVSRYTADWKRREEGMDWPPDAETMSGIKRLENLRDCIAQVLLDDIPGDFIETGTWRGGAAIFMRGALAAYEDPARTVWVADSFEGLPRPDPQYPRDATDSFWESDYLAVPLETVQENFRRYGLLDDRVRFLKGWFKDTLPAAPIDKLAILRLDGDMYGSTIQALESLYPKVSVGGYVIVDDYGDQPGCRAAVEDYRKSQGIKDEIKPIDWTGVYWRRAGH